MTFTPTSFAPSVYRERLHQAQRTAASKGIDLLIIGTGADFAYLTGSWMSSHERLTALVIPAQGDCRVVAPQTDYQDLFSSPLGEMGVEIRGWKDGEDPYSIALEGVEAPKRVALGSSLTADHVLRFQQLLSHAEFSLATYALAELFMSKDAAEIAELSKAGAAIDVVHDAVPQLLQAGLTEAQVAAQLHEKILREHAEVDFVIVGSGPNGANPHHSFSDRVMEHGDPVVVDIGGTLPSGYHSDCTRTYIVGGDLDAAPAGFTQAYDVLLKAQAAGRAQAIAGSIASEVDEVTRRIISDAGFGEYFVHRTGHGIGLSTHEEPFIMRGNEVVLQPGMAFSIEPGIYMPGQWGMRLEDIVVVGDAECICLNDGPRELR
ncbi:M24 family metallopeptidase [Corynebacterium flavescens]|uniref:M24 family metallopeptidase n=1 Tax=Corynebacterium flavescens TaxID=28028 RepID=UPI003FD559F3